jgi:hypothetical protein
MELNDIDQVQKYFLKVLGMRLLIPGDLTRNGLQEITILGLKAEERCGHLT